MKQGMKPVWGLFVVLLAVVGANLLWKATRPAEIIPWRTSYTAALDEGRTANKPILVYFTADWCGPCQSLKHTTWADKSVEAALRDYVTVKVDIDEHPNLAAKYGVRAVPAFAVLRGEDAPLRRAEGAMAADDFLRWLKS